TRRRNVAWDGTKFIPSKKTFAPKHKDSVVEFYRLSQGAKIRFIRKSWLSDDASKCLGSARVLPIDRSFLKRSATEIQFSASEHGWSEWQATLKQALDSALASLKQGPELAGSIPIQEISHTFATATSYAAATTFCEGILPAGL